MVIFKVQIVKKHRLVLPVFLAAALAAPVAASSGAPTAVVAKKKCKKAKWKCAPKMYRLSASGVIKESDGDVGFWSAEVDMRKYRANIGHVDYSQAGGTVTVSGSGTVPYSDSLPGCMTDVSYSVPEQKLKVPARGLNNTDFGVFFELPLLKGDKNVVYVNMGYVQSEFSNINGTATLTCPGDSRSASVPFAFTGSNEIIGPLEEGGWKGAPFGATLKGSASSAGNDSVEWTLTPKK